MIRVATVADCVQNPPRNGVACGRGFTVEHMSKGEQMQEQKMPVVAVVLAAPQPDISPTHSAAAAPRATIFLNITFSF